MVQQSCNKNFANGKKVLHNKQAGAQSKTLVQQLHDCCTIFAGNFIMKFK